ncbi:MAG TPA: hypothetical protein VLT33_38540 [Labilithrix sp.]|nr:hypothetical protein [Labilithrix sp.]
MFGIILALLLPGILIAVIRTNKHTDRRVLPIILGGYFLRFVLQFFFRDVEIFSYGAGGDWIHYEEQASVVRQFWEHGVYQYVTADDYPGLGQTTLPANIFGFIYFLNGGATRVGCCAVIAVAASLTCLNLYWVGLEFQVDPKKMLRILLVMFFGPAFLVYTSDLYKDGLVLFFVVGSFASTLRLSRRFSFLHLAIGVLSCAALLGCRFYLVFVTVTPLIMGLVGIGSKSLTRQILSILALIGGLIFAIAYTRTVGAVNETAELAWQSGASAASITSNAEGGSGIVFDDGGSPTGALHWKILYTLFAPFPWMTGSFALHLGKIEAIIWYYMLYRAYVASKVLWRENRGLLITFLSFLVPTTIMYAFIMSNVGLMVRERMGIVYIGYLLGALSWAPPEALRTVATKVVAAFPVASRTLRARRAARAA